MLAVIIETGRAPEDAAALLGQLTAGAVEGLVREVALVGPASPVRDDLCEATGAEPHPSVAMAARAAKAALVMVLPASFRFREGWIERLSRFLADGGKAARVVGRARPAGVLVERHAVVDGADLHRLRRQLGLWARRSG
jgi:hypothetical protein